MALFAGLYRNADCHLLSIHQGCLKPDRESAFTLGDRGDKLIIIMLAGIIDDTSKIADLNASCLEIPNHASIRR